MADLNKADEDRLRAVEKVAAVGKPVGVVLVAVIALAAIGYTNLVSTIGELKSTTASHTADIPKLKKCYADETVRLEKRIDRLPQQCDNRSLALDVRSPLTYPSHRARSTPWC